MESVHDKENDPIRPLNKAPAPASSLLKSCLKSNTSSANISDPRSPGFGLSSSGIIVDSNSRRVSFAAKNRMRLIDKITDESEQDDLNIGKLTIPELSSVRRASVGLDFPSLEFTDRSFSSDMDNSEKELSFEVDLCGSPNVSVQHDSCIKQQQQHQPISPLVVTGINSFTATQKVDSMLMVAPSTPTFPSHLENFNNINETPISSETSSFSSQNNVNNTASPSSPAPRSLRFQEVSVAATSPAQSDMEITTTFTKLPSQVPVSINKSTGNRATRDSIAPFFNNPKSPCSLSDNDHSPTSSSMMIMSPSTMTSLSGCVPESAENSPAPALPSPSIMKWKAPAVKSMDKKKLPRDSIAPFFGSQDYNSPVLSSNQAPSTTSKSPVAGGKRKPRDSIAPFFGLSDDTASKIDEEIMAAAAPSPIVVTASSSTSKSPVASGKRKPRDSIAPFFGLSDDMSSKIDEEIMAAAAPSPIVASASSTTSKSSAAAGKRKPRDSIAPFFGLSEDTAIDASTTSSVTATKEKSRKARDGTDPSTGSPTASTVSAIPSALSSPIRSSPRLSQRKGGARRDSIAPFFAKSPSAAVKRELTSVAAVLSSVVAPSSSPVRSSPRLQQKKARDSIAPFFSAKITISQEEEEELELLEEGESMDLCGDDTAQLIPGDITRQPTSSEPEENMIMSNDTEVIIPDHVISCASPASMSMDSCKDLETNPLTPTFAQLEKQLAQKSGQQEEEEEKKDLESNENNAVYDVSMSDEYTENFSSIGLISSQESNSCSNENESQSSNIGAESQESANSSLGVNYSSMLPSQISNNADTGLVGGSQSSGSQSSSSQESLDLGMYGNEFDVEDTFSMRRGVSIADNALSKIPISPIRRRSARLSSPVKQPEPACDSLQSPVVMEASPAEVLVRKVDTMSKENSKAPEVATLMVSVSPRKIVTTAPPVSPSRTSSTTTRQSTPKKVVSHSPGRRLGRSAGPTPLRNSFVPPQEDDEPLDAVDKETDKRSTRSESSSPVREQVGEHSLSATNLSNKNKKSRLSLSASSPINKTKSAPSPSRLPIKSSPVKPPSTAVTPSKEKESTAKAAKFGRLSLGGSLSERKAVKQKRISLAPVSGIASINYDLEISRDSKKPKIEDQSSYHPCSEDEKNTHVCINTSTTTAKSIVRTPTAAVSRRVSLAPNLLAASVKRNLRSSVSSTPASSLLKASDGGGAPGATPFVVPATTPGGRKVDSKHRASMGPRLFKALEEMKKLDAVLNDDKPFSGDQQQSRTEDEAAVVEESEAVLAAEEQAVFEELISETSVAVNDAATVAATTTIATSLESNDVGFMDDETPSFVVDCSFTAEEHPQKEGNIESISEFLETTGTQFNDALDVDVDRDLEMFRNGEDSANHEDYMLAVLKDLPTLEVVQAECDEITNLILEGEETLEAIEKDVCDSLPLIFFELPEATLKERAEIIKNLHITKRFAQLEAEKMMCERGLEMQKSLNQTYLGSMDKIKRDRKVLDHYMEQVSNIIESIDNESIEIEEQSTEIKKQIDTAKKEEEDRISELDIVIEEHSDRSKGMTKAIEEANAQITMLEQLIEKSKRERPAILKSIENSETVIEKNMQYKPEVFGALREDYQLFVATHLWTVHKLTGKSVSFLHDNVIKVAFEAKDGEDAGYTASVGVLQDDQVSSSSLRVLSKEGRMALKGLGHDLVDSIFQGFIFQGFSSTSAPIDSKEAIHDLLEKVSLVWSRLKLIHRDVQNARRNCIIEYVQYPIIPPANAQSNLKEEENMNDSPSPTSVSPQFGIKTTFYHCKARMRLNTIFWVSFASSNIKDCGLVYPFSTRVPITTWTDCCNESSTTSSISLDDITELCKSYRSYGFLQQVCKNLGTLF